MILSGIEKNMYADTADLEHLIRNGNDRGCYINQATYSEITAQFNCEVPLGSRWNLEVTRKYMIKGVEDLFEQMVPLDYLLEIILRYNQYKKYKPYTYKQLKEKEAASIPGRVEEGKKDIDNYVHQKETELKGETGNVHFAAFKVVKGRLKMYSDPTVDKMCFSRKRSRLKYRLKF